MSHSLLCFYVELCQRVLGCANAHQTDNAYNLLRLAMICDDNRAPEVISDVACEMDFAFMYWQNGKGDYDHDKYCAALKTLETWVNSNLEVISNAV